MHVSGFADARGRGTGLDKLVNVFWIIWEFVEAGGIGPGGVEAGGVQVALISVTIVALESSKGPGGLGVIKWRPRGKECGGEGGGEGGFETSREMRSLLQQESSTI